MKTHAPTSRSSVRTPGRLGWHLLIPLLALTLPAQATGPELNIERAAAVVSWPLSETNYILLSSANLDGPWYPCLDPVASGQDGCQVAVRTTDHSQYFKLAQGEWFMEDFEHGDLESWMVGYTPPQWSNDVTLEVTNGQLHVYGTNAAASPRSTLFWTTNLMMADFAMSIDIRGWDESVAGDNPSVLLLGRAHPDSEPNGDVWAYAAILNVLGAVPSQSLIRLHEYTGAGQQTIASQAFERVDPAKDYRLVFYCVGSELTVQLFDLTNGDLVDECRVTDTSLSHGWIGFGAFEYGSSGTVDFWLDNFVAVGTTL